MAPQPGQDRLSWPSFFSVQKIGRAEMDGPGRPGAGQGRRLVLAAILALVLVIGGIAYRNSDGVIDLAKSLTSGQTGRAQSRIHY
jgi:hypothetical protein